MERKGDRLPPGPAFRHGLLHTLKAFRLRVYWFPLLRPQERAFAGWRIASQCLPCHAGRVPCGISRNRLPGWVFGFRSCLRKSVRSRTGAKLSRFACPATQGGCLTAPARNRLPGWVFGFRSCLRKSVRSRTGAKLSRFACPATQGGCLTAPSETGCPAGKSPGVRAHRSAAWAWPEQQTDRAFHHRTPWIDACRFRQGAHTGCWNMAQVHRRQHDERP